MQRLPFLFLMAVMYLSGCKKDSENELQNKLNGTWELRTAGGGYSSMFITYPAGNGNTIRFSGSHQYTRTDIIDGDTTTSSGTYTTTKGNTCYSSDVMFIKFSDGGLDNSSILEFSGDALQLNTNSCLLADGVNHSYEKIK